MLPAALKKPQGGKLLALVVLRSACATLRRERRDAGRDGTRGQAGRGDRRDACPTPGQAGRGERWGQGGTGGTWGQGGQAGRLSYAWRGETPVPISNFWGVLHNSSTRSR
jgi:hypothetical protein